MQVFTRYGAGLKLNRLALTGAALVVFWLVLGAGCRQYDDVGKADLTPQERQWLQEHKSELIVQFDRKFSPMEFLNQENEFDGMASDLCRLLEEALGVRFTYRPSTSWTDLLMSMREGRAAIAPTVVGTSARREYMNFTTPYITLPLVIITSKGFSGGQNLESLRGRKVAVVKNYAAVHYLRKHYKDSFDIVEVPTIQVGLRDVSFGVVDALVENLAVAAWCIEKETLPNLKVAGSVGFEYKLSIGSRKDWPMLGHILQKGLDAIPESRLHDVFHKWISLDVGGRYVPEWLAKVAIGLLALLAAGGAVVVMFNRILRRRVERKTRALRRELDMRKQTQEALRLAEDRYRSIFMNAPVGAFRITLGGSFIDINPAFCRMLNLPGKPSLQSGGRPDGLGQYLPRQGLMEVLSPLLSANMAVIREVWLAKTTGEIFQARMWLRAERNGSGSVMYVDGFAEDVTERHRAKQIIIEARDAAEAANRSKNEFLANMSHEIRTPLNGIFGMLQLLEMSELDASQKEYVQMARTTGRRLLAILSDILDFANIEAGRVRIEESPMNIREVVTEVAESFATQTDEQGGNGPDIRLQVASSTPEEVQGDSGRLRQVLFNLVGNAIKFAQDGRIVIEAFPLPYGRRGERGLICFCVSDQGIGIADDRLEDVFTPFAQGDSSSRKIYPGTGLGLGIVRKLVGMMGGTISVDTKEGRGTDMYFTILVRMPEQESEALALASTAPLAECVSDIAAATGRKIIVADDDPTSLRILVNGLEVRGHAVYMARNGREVLDLLKVHSVDCILMDVYMPLMSGLDAAEAIRSGKAGNSDVPIIALSAYSVAGDRSRLLKTGMNEVLSKPYDFEALSEVMDRICQ
ncbi:MAG: ATP-binding protein [Desulfovibrio sp.]|uniref:ATP-binding protein n=1 Tax=Desulfovibrio sp. 7SRBS1 TaxID=3378064 RepID=UPI003B3D358F